MSGCAGSQAVAVSMREVTLGLLKPTEFLRVWIKEASVGILNGLALEAMMGLAAWAWQGNASTRPGDRRVARGTPCWAR